MIDKFQKLFGPNPPRTSASGLTEAGFDTTPEDDAHRKLVARIKNKRRLLGLMVLVMAVAVVAPSFFEPNDYYADRGAKLEIPALQDETPAKVVSLAPQKAEPLKDTPVVPSAPSAAASLSSANKVAAGIKPAPDEPKGNASGAAKAQTTKPTPAAAATGGSSPADIAKSTQTMTNAGNGKDRTAKSSGAANETSAGGGTPGSEPLRAVANGRYFIQVIATSHKDSAQKQADKLRALGLPAYTEIVHRRGTDLWRVRVGRFASEQEAKRALDILAFNAIENGGVNQEAAQK